MLFNFLLLHIGDWTEIQLLIPQPQAVSHHSDLWTWEQELLFSAPQRISGSWRLPTRIYLARGPCETRRAECLWSAWSLCKPRAAAERAVVMVWENSELLPSERCLFKRLHCGGYSCSCDPLGWTSMWSACQLCSHLLFLWLLIHLLSKDIARSNLWDSYNGEACRTHRLTFTLPPPPPPHRTSLTQSWAL